MEILLQVFHQMFFFLINFPECFSFFFYLLFVYVFIDFLHLLCAHTVFRAGGGCAD